MEKQEIFEKILLAMKSISPDNKADFSKLDRSTSFEEDLGFDSISILMLGAALEESFNIHPTDKRISNFNTIGDVVDYVYSKIN